MYHIAILFGSSVYIIIPYVLRPLLFEVITTTIYYIWEQRVLGLKVIPLTLARVMKLQTLPQGEKGIQG